MSRRQRPVRHEAPLLLALANAGRPRRDPKPGNIPRPFATRNIAAEFLRSLGVTAPVGDQDLPDLERLAQEVSDVATALVHHQAPPVPAVTNQLAAQCCGHRTLMFADGQPRTDIVWHAPGAASELARRVIDELAHVDPARLRECARPACSLLFYDTTRSNTQRWHAEDPCGWLERQARHRARLTDPHG